MLLSVCGSCKKSIKDIETSYLTSAIEKLNVDDTVKWMVILPGLGCHGCIQEGEAFMKDYILKRDILFVLTNISSIKILQQKVGLQVREQPNIYIDRDNAIMIPTENKIYPCIIRLEHSKIVKYEFQSPSNGQAFWKLKGLITAQ